jgi:hypothetical protein
MRIMSQMQAWVCVNNYGKKSISMYSWNTALKSVTTEYTKTFALLPFSQQIQTTEMASASSDVQNGVNCERKFLSKNVNCREYLQRNFEI